MTNTFFNSKGNPINLGRELGKGGEGVVYEVLENNSWVAKLYDIKHQPDALKQAKLRFMVTVADEELLAYAAWPQETLRKSTNGPIVGFLMPKISGREPVHMLYSPAHRKQKYPSAAWDFLLFVARNTAAAFEVIHQRGHVLGDVNQGNVLVSADSKVALIDTDSFQVKVHDNEHLCKVGVAHFTPPELQGDKPFTEITRSTNHDNFGLALLIFHLLFGGRHPYSGVPLRNDVGEALEQDIKAFRYAYAADKQNRGLAPPPKSIPIAIIPDSMQNMFTRAFTENGAKHGRPTAQHWVTALDQLRGQLKRCANSRMHIYSNHLDKCPWCELDAEGIVYFLDYQTGINPINNNFVLDPVWKAIEAVLPPPELCIPNINNIMVTPTPLPPGIDRTVGITFLRIMIIGAALWVFLMVHKAWFFILLGAWLMWAKAGELGSSKREEERIRRQLIYSIAKQEYDHIYYLLDSTANPKEFNKKKLDLTRLRDEYLKLPETEKSELERLFSTAKERQKRQFLERHFIDIATIPGVGSAKKAALRSFGIETAADVTWNNVIRVRGFGEVLTRAVVDWQKACERRFVFNHQTAVTENDKNAVRAKIATRKHAIEVRLSAGAAALQQERQKIINTTPPLFSELQIASLNLAQAQADLKLIT